ncbi:MAG: beta-phosphoglucomutase family hydrolase [bacterium]
MKVDFKGAIFDMDGVITTTASVHSRAWKAVFDEFLKNRAEKKSGEFVPFTHEKDYLPYVDGKPRLDGIKSFLDSRKIKIPEGGPEDPPGRTSVWALGNRKNKLFRKIVSEDGVEVFEPAVKLVRELQENGIKVGVATSSKNCRFILEKAGLLELFETIVDGVVSNKLKLKGKPAPDIFITAARNLNLLPGECLMVEDAIAGVRAGKNGNFALVLGVARNFSPDILLSNGADMAVKNMGEISLGDIHEWFSKGIEEDSWNLSYHKFVPEEEKLRETLTAVGNGYFATRGCFVGEKASGVHYPGTYIAGVYNKLPSKVYGKTIFNNDFVNCPNWLPLEFKIGQGNYVHPCEHEVLSYRHNLNMKDAVMTREIIFRDNEKRVTKIASRRFASMDNPHLAAISFTITPVNYSQWIELRSTLDGMVINSGVARYRHLSGKHLAPVSERRNRNEIYLHVETSFTKTKIFMTSRMDVYRGDSKIKPEKVFSRKMGKSRETVKFYARRGVPHTVEKLVSIYTAKDRDVSFPKMSSAYALSHAESFLQLFERHRMRWHTLWKKADYLIEGDRFVQKVIRLHIYHLLTTGSVHNRDIDAGMPARGLHGEAYRGHIFWDMLFMFPFYNLHFPEAARSFLMYRYRRLDAAREHARESGFEGALYPWQTADYGKEETQVIHYNPVSCKWDEDLSKLQRHCSIAVLYNIWEYYYCTGDIRFLNDYGAEMMIEISRGFVSMTEFDEKDGRYHIRGVMGPDEFHEKYPRAKKGGINDNSYTNIMAAWLLRKTIEMAGHLPDRVRKRISEKINFNFAQIKEWEKIVRKMKVVFIKDDILSQFEGYSKLKDINLQNYRRKYGDIGRMDRLLKAEKDSPNNYKISKQADTLMTFYMLSPGQVAEILRAMGYRIKTPASFFKKNYEYYVTRTSHGSTLSQVVHSAILKHLKSRNDEMRERFLKAMRSDIYDTQGGTTPEGIHCGVMAGTVDIIMKTFSGVSLFNGYIKISPRLPSHWKNLSFSIVRKKVWYDIHVDRSSIRVKAHGPGKSAAVKVGARLYKLRKNRVKEIKYAAG